jgi:hypothetical protein
MSEERYFATKPKPAPDDPTAGVWKITAGKVYMLHRTTPHLWTKSACEPDDFIGPSGKLRRHVTEIEDPYEYLGITKP